jgi:hypothetical protein
MTFGERKPIVSTMKGRKAARKAKRKQPTTGTIVATIKRKDGPKRRKEQTTEVSSQSVTQLTGTTPKQEGKPPALCLSLSRKA